MSDQDIRWQQRFKSFVNALNIFKESRDAFLSDQNNHVYQMAIIHSFTVVYELGWKMLKDYLSHSGLAAVSLPRDVIKEAFKHQIIVDGQLWIDMMESRNVMVHVYSEAALQRIANDIIDKYQLGLDQIYAYFCKMNEKDQ